MISSFHALLNMEHRIIIRLSNQFKIDSYDVQETIISDQYFYMSNKLSCMFLCKNLFLMMSITLIKDFLFSYAIQNLKKVKIANVKIHDTICGSC